MLVISLINPINAGVLKGNLSNSIETSYAPSQIISGWINISLNSVSANSKLKSSLGGEISLISLLKKSQNSNFSYTCVPFSCNNSYASQNESNYKSLKLNKSETKLIGFKITSNGEVSSISSFSMKLNANHKEASELPILVDVLDDESIEWQNYIPSTNYNQKNYGCFVDQNTDQVLIDVNTYCQRVLFTSSSPGLKIGAQVTGTGTAKFELSISDEDMTKNCEANTTGSGEISCLPGVLYVSPGEYSLCIKAKDTNAKAYSIKKEDVSPCGYTGDEEYFYDFQIFSQQRKYSSLGLCPIAQPNLCSDNEGNTFCIAENCPSSDKILLNSLGGCPATHSNLCAPRIEPENKFCMNTTCPIYNQILDSTPTTIILNDSEFKKATGETKDIESEIYDYISYEYNGNCSNGCIIPIRVYSGIRQALNFSNFNIAYSAGGLTQTTNKLYDLEQDVPKINSGYGKIYLNPAEFHVPPLYGNKTLSISLDETPIFSSSIFIQNMTTISYIFPTATAKNYPTTFGARLSSNTRIIKYTWDFGDGTIYETGENKAIHTYRELGNYSIQLKIQDNSSRTTTGIFLIEVISSRDIVPELVQKSLANLDSLKTSLNNFSLFERFGVNYSLDLPNKESLLKRINSSLSSMNESQYDQALGELMENEIPSTIVKTSETDFNLYVTEENIDMDLVADYFKTQINSSEEAYKSEIIAWNLENLNLKIKERKILGYYNSGYPTPVSKIFKLNIDRKSQSNQDMYLFIPKLEKLIFYEDYREISQDDYWIIPLNSNSNEIIFSTAQDVEIVDIPAFVSPRISELTVIEIYDDSVEVELRQKNKQILFLITCCIVLFIGGVAWFLIQRWYKKKYETHLFKDRNNLYNIINYIHDSKKAGVEEKEIVKSLRRNGWTGEQITYALKKYKGKRVKIN